MNIVRRYSRLFWRVAFFLGVICGTILACLPHPPDFPGDPANETLHFLAFAVLSFLAWASFPDASLWKILMGLAALGAGIEFLQAIPIFQRDPSWMDWLIDLAAIIGTLAIIGTFRAICRSIPGIAASGRAGE